MRVCIFVFNDCTVDSRIFREAQTFADHGHDTIIVALQRRSVPFIERRDGYQIRRVPTKYRWREGYPRLLGMPARLLGFGVRPFDLEEMQASQRVSVPPEAGPEDEPATTVEQEIVPPQGGRLSPEQWVRWIRSGEGLGPRSWSGNDEAGAADRLRHVWSGPGRLLFRRTIRFARKALRRARRKVIRMIGRTRRFVTKRLLLPTRFRQIDRRMAEEAARFHADLYWANDVTTLRAAKAAARKTGAVAVYDAHEVIWDAPTVSPLKRRLWGLVERTHVRKVSRVSTVCDPIAREMQSRYGIDLPEVILNCPRLSDTTAAVEPSASPINAHRKPGERIILFHGSLSPWRGLEQVLHALTMLPQEYRLVILGHGSFRETLESLATELGVADRVTFLQSVPPSELPDWLAGADLGLIPYQRKGRNHEYSTPNKLFEYMHLGIPVLVNDLPEIRRIVTEIDYGAIVDCSDPSEIAKGIQDVLSDPVRYAQMRSNARAGAERYSWESQEHKVLAALPKS
ncbi:MAG: glycosyltransferase [Actinomycetota bacterium]|nr:glycosyltransferase [Actinomycetota bacterium]